MAARQIPTKEYSGWLHKWTNYIHGYQKRFFRLKGEHLCYYRSDNESSPCRGKIKVDKCIFHVQSSTMFTISSETQTYTLRAMNEIQRQYWIHNLELARTQIKQYKKNKRLQQSQAQSRGLSSQSSSQDSEASRNSTKHHSQNYRQPSPALNHQNSQSQSQSHSRSTPHPASKTPEALPPEPHRVKFSSPHTPIAHKPSNQSQTTLQSEGPEASTLMDETSSLGSSNDGDSKPYDPSRSPVNVSGMKQLLKQLQCNVNNPEVFLKLAKDFVMMGAQLERESQAKISEERRKRSNLETQIEALAQQHLNLEDAARTSKKASSVTNNNSNNINHHGNHPQVQNSSAPALQANLAGSPERSRTGTSSTAVPSEDTFDEFEDALSDGFEINEDDVQLLENMDFQSRGSMSNGLDEKNSVQGEGEALTTEEEDPTPVPSLETSHVEQESKVNFLTGSYLEPPYEDNQAIKITTRNRRKTIAPRSNSTLNLWNLIKNFVGQDLSRIPMPVNFNEPLSMLQRMSETIEYHEILDTAATKTDSCEQMAYICAHEVSKFSCTRFRINKPFNPLLGETFEIDRYYEKEGYRLIIEQTSHHPPAASYFIESRKGWVSWGHSTLTSKFRGNYLSVSPIGLTHIYFPASKNHYTVDTITTTAHNIIVGKLWMDNSGDQIVINHRTNDYCVIKYHPYSYFSRDPPRRVTGAIIEGRSKQAKYVLNGDWDAKMSMKVVSGGGKAKGGKSGPNYQTSGNPIQLWKKSPVLAEAAKRYHFTDFSFTLNQLEEGLSPTDSRHRPDQRLMEQGHWDEANEVKKLLEEAQRKRRRELEAAAKDALAAGREPETYKATWFRKVGEVPEAEQNIYYKMSVRGMKNYKMVSLKLKPNESGSSEGESHTIVEPHLYSHKYWSSKAAQTWPERMSIFNVKSENAQTNNIMERVIRSAQAEIVPVSPVCQN